MTFLAVAAIATWRASRDAFWLVTGLGIIGTTVFALIRYGNHGLIFGGPIGVSTALMGVMLGCLLWAQLVSLPRPLARLLGIGLRSRAIAFSNRLIAVRKPFTEALRLADEDPDRRLEALARADEQVRRMRALRAPDAAWAFLRDDLANDSAARVALLRAGAPPERLEDHDRAAAPVVARWVAMNDEAAIDQRTLATPARRRRGTIVWLVSLGVVSLFMGFAQGIGSDVTVHGLADPRAWLALVELALGGATLVGAVVLAWRR